MAEVYDRWWRVDRETGKKVRAADYGCKSRWQVRYYDDQGKQRKRNYEKRAHADAYRNEVAASLHQGSYIDPAGGKTKLRDYALSWLAAQTFGPSTREMTEIRIRLHILPELGDLQLRALRPSVIQAWLRGLQGHLAPNSVRVVYTVLASILSAAVDDGLLAKSPCRAASVKPPPLERRKVIPWTGERAAAVTAALPERTRIVGILAAGLGLRQGEAFGLGVDDVDFLRQVVHVRRQVRVVAFRLVFAPPKAGKERDVPLGEQVALRLSAHLRAYPAAEVTLPWKEPGGRPETARLIATTTSGTALDKTTYNRRVWKPALKAAGVPAGRENGMHALRHYFASVALENGVSIKALAEYLGHADPGFTLRVYTHLMPASEGKLRSAVDAALGSSALNVPSGAADAP